MSFEGDINAPFSHLLDLADAEVDATIASLPPEIRDALKSLPVILEEFPSPAALADGIMPDQQGIFHGGSACEYVLPQLSRIILWLGNLWEMCEADEASYGEEVRITLPHEFGHFLGWDEEDLLDRGLEYPPLSAAMG